MCGASNKSCCCGAWAPALKAIPIALNCPAWSFLPARWGQGFGVAQGCAMNAKLEGKNYRVYAILGDGELDEGSMWETAMAAAHYKLDNLCAIVDRNRLQIDGFTSEVMEIEPLKDKFEAFGWHVIEIDGHDMEQILRALQQAEQIKGKPTCILPTR